MANEKRPMIPVRLIVLDLIGTILIAIGLFEGFGPEHSLLPQALHFPYYEWVLILVGLLIMLPAVFAMVTRLGGRRPQPS